MLTRRADGGEERDFYLELAANHMFGNDNGGIGMCVCGCLVCEVVCVRLDGLDLYYNYFG